MLLINPSIICLLKCQVFLITMMVYSSVPVSHGCDTVSQHEQHLDPDTVTATETSTIIYFTIHTCAFPAVTCQNLLHEKGLMLVLSDQLSKFNLQ